MMEERSRREGDEVSKQYRNETLGAFMCLYMKKKARYKLGHTQLSLWDLRSRDFQLLERLLAYDELMFCQGGAHAYTSLPSLFHHTRTIGSVKQT